MSGMHDCGGDAAAYVLGALEPAEAEAFREHLQECAVCRDEVEALGGVVQTLPMSTVQYAAPRGLRRRVTREVRDHGTVAKVTRRRGLLAAAGAAVLAAAGVIAGLELSAGTAVRVFPAKIAGISGSAQVQVTGDRGELVVRHLTPPPRHHVYEVWLQSGNAAPVPASVLFGVNAAGDADVGIPRRLHGVTAVLVTPEPYGGTQTPTHKPVITAPLD
jgi:hypothetical protein